MAGILQPSGRSKHWRLILRSTRSHRARVFSRIKQLEKESLVGHRNNALPDNLREGVNVRRSYQINVTLFTLLSCVSAAAQSLPFDTVSDSSSPSFLPVSIAADFGDHQPESQTSELEDRVQRLEAELDALRSRPVYDAQATLEQRLRNQDAGSGGLYGSVEVTFLRPHISGSPSFFASAGGARRMIDSSYQTNVRYQLGYKSDSGFGVRGRYFSYDHDFSYVAPWAPGQFKSSNERG